MKHIKTFDNVHWHKEDPIYKEGDYVLLDFVENFLKYVLYNKGLITGVEYIKGMNKYSYEVKIKDAKGITYNDFIIREEKFIRKLTPDEIEHYEKDYELWRDTIKYNL